ncbi:MAG: agmatinase [Flavobacteriales bacterium]|jgi:agmatinase|uniref:agmatinase n=1 Tax=Blattabacterium sp. (Mastotermes darwiniensis) TaxID=39768 RepID=UPI000231DF0A|nr:agmatinase [Blattabacterium sp. (Mastotermes darwiniensis)]AER40830.1 agmatinase [Blattabacterium sp. (Mastotermes darwiniensis) str. MADAR]MDR1804677.1 agmatinase [Flavobacteriales bacterium]
MKKKTFAGIPKKYATLEKSQIVLIPVPYDSTETWKKGSNRGPEAFLSASEHMELYDIETDSEVYKKGIFLAAPIGNTSLSSNKMIEKVYHTTKKYLLKEKFVTLIGGEHSISIGSIRAFGEKYTDMSILHMDAHTDLRPKYNGNPYNHACSMFEASKKYPLIQIGIRSMDVLEKKYIQNENIFYFHKIYQNDSWMKEAIQRLSQNVFISIDIDVFDPSIAPSTGTPEPGGFFWYEILKFFRMVFENKKIIGFDIVELLPNKKDYSTDFLSVKLYYKLLSYKYY